MIDLKIFQLIIVYIHSNFVRFQIFLGEIFRIAFGSGSLIFRLIRIYIGFCRFCSDRVEK